MSQCPCKVQDSIHKTIWGPKFYTCPSGAQNFTQGLGCQLIFEISKFFYTEFVLNVFSVPRWVFLANGIKMTLKVPGAILARFENSDPLCGPTMENARIFNTHHGSKRPIMDPPNHAVMCIGAGWMLSSTHSGKNNTGFAWENAHEGGFFFGLFLVRLTKTWKWWFWC